MMLLGQFNYNQFTSLMLTNVFTNMDTKLQTHNNVISVAFFMNRGSERTVLYYYTKFIFRQYIYTYITIYQYLNSQIVFNIIVTATFNYQLTHVSTCN